MSSLLILAAADYEIPCR